MTAQPASALVPILAQHIKGKTILVLGASPNSLGARFLEAIKPAEPGLVILGLRNESKAKEVASTLSPVPTRTFTVDFASFANVRTAAQHVLAMDEKIDVLVNNIGTMASPYYKTEDGFESQLQLNHLSFFLFTNLIMDKLLASKTRIVNITSEGYSIGGIRYHDWNFHVSTSTVTTSTSWQVAAVADGAIRTARPTTRSLVMARARPARSSSPRLSLPSSARRVSWHTASNRVIPAGQTSTPAGAHTLSSS
jgi:NAD(P)-dependent dehydrogenase (short-subunit alcohol dehydrogenase family)